ncbi:MAG TPA: VOC family protein [Acidimicrobiales bacterium]|nr:VOC family protein [Acidimicrobiales bacterium]
MADRHAFQSAPFKQVALVVEDLDVAVKLWHERLGIGPWTAWHLGPHVFSEMRYRGEPASFEFRHALCWQGDMQFELVQPLSGPSIFSDHLGRCGPGLQHIGKYVDDHPAAVEAIVADGFTPLQSARGFGADGDGAFAYFQAPGLDVIVELISPPERRIEPEFVYPPPES